MTTISKTVKQLKEEATALNIPGRSKMNKAELILAIDAEKVIIEDKDELEEIEELQEELQELEEELEEEIEEEIEEDLEEEIEEDLEEEEIEEDLEEEEIEEEEIEEELEEEIEDELENEKEELKEIEELQDDEEEELENVQVPTIVEEEIKSPRRGQLPTSRNSPPRNKRQRQMEIEKTVLYDGDPWKNTTFEEQGHVLFPPSLITRWVDEMNKVKSKKYRLKPEAIELIISMLTVFLRRLIRLTTIPCRNKQLNVECIVSVLRQIGWSNEIVKAGINAIDRYARHDMNHDLLRRYFGHFGRPAYDVSTASIDGVWVSIPGTNTIEYRHEIEGTAFHSIKLENATEPRRFRVTNDGSSLVASFYDVNKIACFNTSDGKQKWKSFNLREGAPSMYNVFIDGNEIMIEDDENHFRELEFLSLKDGSFIRTAKSPVNTYPAKLNAFLFWLVTIFIVRGLKDTSDVKSFSVESLLSTWSNLQSEDVRHVINDVLI